MKVRHKVSLAITLLSGAAAGGYYWVQADPDAIYLEGRKAIELGHWAEVIEKTESLKEFPEYDSQRALLTAFEFKSRGNLETALVEFSKAHAHPATREESYFQGGSICYQLKQYGDCIRLFRQVLTWNPEHLEAHQLLAAAYYDIGSMGMAVESLRNVIRLRPDDFRPHYMLGTIYLEAERFGDAQAALAMAVDLAPVRSNVVDEIRAELGNCLIRLRRFEEALSAMEPAQPWPDILTHRAQACYSLRQFDNARRFAQEALSLEPLNPESTIIIAQIYERDGDPEAGISLLRKCLAAHPMKLTLHQKLGELLASAGHVEESLMSRKRAGEIAELRNQFSIAHQNAATDTANPELRLKLAELAEKLGETELARGWYIAALGISPNDEQAQDRWKKFQALNPPPVSQDSPRDNAIRSSMPKAAAPLQNSPNVEF
jgi:tetratricopeptide (TPR) repeat protein